MWAKLPPRSPVPSPKYMMWGLARISSAMPSRTASSQPWFRVSPVASGRVASGGLSGVA